MHGARFYVTEPPGQPQLFKQIKGRYHLTKVRMAIIKKLQTTNDGEHVAKSEPSYALGGNVNKFI